MYQPLQSTVLLALLVLLLGTSPCSAATLEEPPAKIEILHSSNILAEFESCG